MNEALSPPHYKTAAGFEVWDVHEAYRLGHHLSAAFEYILRAGKKTADPREDLNKAIIWLNRAAQRGRDLVHGLPLDTDRPSPAAVTTAFRLGEHLSMAVGAILRPLPSSSDCLVAAQYVQFALDQYEDPRVVPRYPVILDEEVAA